MQSTVISETPLLQIWFCQFGCSPGILPSGHGRRIAKSFLFTASDEQVRTIRVGILELVVCAAQEITALQEYGPRLYTSQGDFMLWMPRILEEFPRNGARVPSKIPKVAISRVMLWVDVARIEQSLATKDAFSMMYSKMRRTCRLAYARLWSIAVRLCTWSISYMTISHEQEPAPFFPLQTLADPGVSLNTATGSSSLMLPCPSPPSSSKWKLTLASLRATRSSLGNVPPAREKAPYLLETSTSPESVSREVKASRNSSSRPRTQPEGPRASGQG